MARPSEPLLRLLRDLARKKGMNTAALAAQTGIDRTRLKHVLSGSESMNVDELLLVANALELDAQALGMTIPDELPAVEGATTDAPAKDPADVAPTDEAPRPKILEDRAAPWVVDPYGNHAEQALRLGFGLGCNLFLWLNSPGLKGSGVPADVLASQGDTLRIQLDAAYHRHNKPVFQHDHIQLVLSFGTTLHTVELPWSAFRQVALIPLAPDPDPTVDEQPEPSGPGRGHLRLVE